MFSIPIHWVSKCQVTPNRKWFFLFYQWDGPNFFAQLMNIREHKWNVQKFSCKINVFLQIMFNLIILEAPVARNSNFQPTAIIAFQSCEGVIVKADHQVPAFRWPQLKLNQANLIEEAVRQAWAEDSRARMRDQLQRPRRKIPGVWQWAKIEKSNIIG